MFHEKYGDSGLNSRVLKDNIAEQEAVENEYEVYKQQYEELQR